MRQLMPLLAAAAMVLSTAPAHADLGDQLFKLLPEDSAAGGRFAHSVAISAAGIVGAWQHDDNGSNSGSAYLFDACCAPIPGEMNCDGQVNAFDIEPFLGLLFP